ncbi:MAG TPA: hypothetical protein VKV03_11190 [Candidatus Binataceae bacterium]|nr:hypothetical protein [Candidatus Binataceae bacterium]
MYALIILRHSKPPQLLTIFKDRHDFVAALGFKNAQDSWQAATKAFRAIYEVRDENEFTRSLETIRIDHPDAYDACRGLLRKFQIPTGLRLGGRR